MPQDPLFFALAVPVVLLVGMSKGGFAGGFGLMAVPVLSLVADPRWAAAVLLPILCVMDVFSWRNFRGQWSPVLLRALFPAALLGTLLGAATAQLANPALLRLLVGLLALGFVAQRLWQALFNQAPPAPRQPRVWAGPFWGGIAGYVSYLAHAGGPPIALYLLPQQLPKSLYTATCVVFFALTNLVKLLAYLAVGQLNAQAFYCALWLMPLAPLGVALGFYCHNKLSEAVFFRLTDLCLALTGGKLLFDGIQALLH
jgi:uncharacterized protein